jgi:hypothetical protein
MSILGTVWNKETYSVDLSLAVFLTKNDRPQNGRLRDGAVNQLNYRNFPAYRCLAYFHAMPSIKAGFPTGAHVSRKLYQKQFVIAQSRSAAATPIYARRTRPHTANLKPSPSKSTTNPLPSSPNRTPIRFIPDHQSTTILLHYGTESNRGA